MQKIQRLGFEKCAELDSYAPVPQLLYFPCARQPQWKFSEKIDTIQVTYFDCFRPFFVNLQKIFKNIFELKIFHFGFVNLIPGNSSVFGYKKPSFKTKSHTFSLHFNRTRP